MRLHRFIGDFDCSQSSIEIGDKDNVNQLANVLRLGVGDRLILGDGRGNECIGEISERQKNTLTVQVIERYQNGNEPDVRGVLYCAILKRENFELVVQKATEIGIGEIVPLITARTVKLDIKEDRLHKIIKEAAEQSGRGLVPVLHRPMRLAEALEQARGNDANFFLALGDVPAQADVLRGGARKGVFIGPEGGWTNAEVDEARAAGCRVASLGALTLRAETAAIVASYKVIHD